MSGQQAELYLIDVSGFVFRAFHALPPLTRADGQPTGAAYGFSNMLLKLLEDARPSHVAAVLDSSCEGGFRKELYADYKAQRPPTPPELISQFPLVDQVLEGLGIRSFRLDGYEADDIIATLAKRARAEGFAVTIVSSDKDLMQLAGERIRLLDTMKDKVFERQEVFDKFGVWPEQLGDWLALVGDASDNVPGVPGIGAKTASKLLGQFGTIAGILSAGDAISGKKLRENLAANEKLLHLSRQLVELAETPLELNIEELRTREFDYGRLAAVFGELQFGRLHARMRAASEAPTLDRSGHRTVVTASELAALRAELKEVKEFSLSLALGRSRAMARGFVGAAIAWGEHDAVYLPVGHSGLGLPPQAELAAVRALLIELFERPTLTTLTADSKALYGLATAWGVKVCGPLLDITLAAYLLEPERADYSVVSLARSHLSYELAPFDKGPVEEQLVEAFSQSICGQAAVIRRLGASLRPELARQPEVAGLLYEVEQPLAEVLAAMEAYGCLVDPDVWRELGSALGKRLSELEAAIQSEAGWPININSPKQLQTLLFEQLGLSAGRKTKTGYSTDAEVLAELALLHPIAAQIDEFRTLSKLKSTYIDALPRLIERRSGRIHTSFNQTVAVTGRLSSSDPNLQNIPIRTAEGRQIRRAFVAPAGRVLMSADYSQVELRILAHLSMDPLLVQAFQQDEDIHARTAAEVFGVAPEQVDAEQRRVAKAVNFGVIYGQTDWGLSRQLKIPRAVAARYIQGYFERYAGVASFMKRLISEAKESGAVYTLLGRKRALPEINSPRFRARSEAERMARNTPIQGTAADLIKVAMVRIQGLLAAEDFDAAMVLTVHDELVFEVAAAQAERLAQRVRETMVGAATLAVPLKVDLAWADNWADAH